MQNNMAYLIDTYRAATHDLRSPNAKTPSSSDYRLCMTAQPRSSHPHQEGAFTHSQDWKGLYSPLVSKLLIPGYVIQGVPSPRQWLSLRCRQHYFAHSSLMIVGNLLIQLAGSMRALVRTSRLHLTVQIRGDNV